ncbi:peptidylprolyl isomerase [Paenibacillus spongiae]|uniref:Foldase protein PrsA n=1 Tax=Paenibacillus spongiae TaxID=2909671 RepID=A0ABY5SEP0_9BACL|nr:peptidylprolyl isomerase [Paenibacillus spongiae]UVI32452.1 peptidylprolyl isomerase [Paenibacillus spongiae]
MNEKDEQQKDLELNKAGGNKEETKAPDNLPGANEVAASQEEPAAREENLDSPAYTGTETDDDRAAEDDKVENNGAAALESGTVPSEPAATGGKSGKGWMIASIVLAVLLAAALIKPPFGGSNEVVAQVNGVDIKKDQLFDSMVELGGDSILENLINEELINQEAKKAGITVTDEDINKEIDTLKKNFPSEEEFNAALMQSNMTIDDLKEQMPIQIQMRKLLEPKAKESVTDEQVKQYFDENKSMYDTEEQVRASHILVETKEEAEAIMKQLNEGADFAALAKEKSIDPGSKDAGGDLNFFPKGAMEEPFEKAAFALKSAGELSPIVQTSHGFHIIKFTEHKAAAAAKFEDHKAEIQESLINSKIGELSQTWMADLKANAKITNHLKKDTEADADGGANTNPAAG